MVLGAAALAASPPASTRTVRPEIRATHGVVAAAASICAASGHW
jgi:hypothetical protein